MQIHNFVVMKNCLGRCCLASALFLLTSAGHSLAMESDPHQLIVHLLPANESSMALIEPVIRLEYHMQRMSIYTLDSEPYIIEYCTITFHIPCEAFEECNRDDTFTVGCSTQIAELHLNVSAGFHVVSIAIQVHNRVVAYSSATVEVLSSAVADMGDRYRRHFSSLEDPCNRANVINAIITQQGYSSYLEVGTLFGTTIERIQCAVKESVDPEKRYGEEYPVPSTPLPSAVLRLSPCHRPHLEHHPRFSFLPLLHSPSFPVS